jgi:RHS repeat-associated protein
MDNLSYFYNDSAGIRRNNRLRHVTDAVAAANYTEDIDGQAVDNYGYDAIGNLTRDNAEKISAITWNVYGKISQITKTASTVVGDLQLIRYGYDASGNRIRKTAYYNQDATNYRAAHTWYVRDASGNVMATYTSAGLMPKTSTRDTTSKVPLYLSELHMYGSSRLGIWSRNVNMDVLPTGGGTVALLGSAGIDTFNRGNKFFELANHLGNVLVTVSDRKIGQSPVNNLYTSFTADVVSATDYAPFGMQMVGRSFDAAGSSAYRYGFNGKENDNEVKGEGNQQEYGFRIYDPRLGKFLSVDPLTREYSMFSSYQYAGNRPIVAIDLEGLEPQEHPYMLRPVGKTYTSTTNQGNIYQAYQVNSSSYGNGKQWVAKIIEEVPPINGMQMKPIDHFMYFNNEAREWQPWQRGDEPSIRLRMSSKLVDGMSTAFFGGAAVGASLPFFSLVGGSGLLSTNITAEAGFLKAFAGGAGDLAAQSTLNPDRPINWYSVGFNALFSNPWTAAAGASATTINKSTGKTELSDSKSFFSNFLFNGLFGSVSSKYFGKYAPKSGVGVQEKAVSTLSTTLVNFWGNTAASASADKTAEELNQNQIPNGKKR